MTTAPATSTPQGYQRWDGELGKGRWAWLVIVVTGIRQALKNNRTRTLVLTSLGLIPGVCALFYVFSLMETLLLTMPHDQSLKSLSEFVRIFLGVDVSGVTQLENYREPLWRCAFFLVIKVQMFWVLIIVAQVASGLISRDIKARALPIYFAKPITPFTYMVGKWAVVACFIAMVTLVPNLLSLTVGTMMTGGLDTWGQTLNLGCDLLLSGLLVCVVGGAIVLALSSMTSDHRYVTVGWLAVTLLLLFGQSLLNQALPGEATTGWLGCISLRSNILILTDWLFDMRRTWEASGLPAEAFSKALVRPVGPFNATVVLAGWTAASILLCYRRVIRFSRSAANV